jgi:hypothetical protein
MRFAILISMPDLKHQTESVNLPDNRGNPEAQRNTCHLRIQTLFGGV